MYVYYFFQVRLAAVRCLHSLSRSVQQLRTTFQVLLDIRLLSSNAHVSLYIYLFLIGSLSLAPIDGIVIG